MGAAAALVAGCGGSQPPVGAPGAMPQSRAIATHANRSRSWMLPEAKSSSLLYVSTSDAGTVAVFSYPKGKPVGTLTGFQLPYGLCSDKEGNVFVVDFKAQQILEYAHGGTAPIATLEDMGNYPNGCAVDPVSGNLAVAGGAEFYANGNVAIYENAQGSPTVYVDTFADFYYCTYDGSGNVFASGTDGQQFWLSELKKGAQALQDITARGINPIAAIQWDGTYLAVESPSGSPDGPATIYQIQVSGSQATILNTIKLYTKQNTNPKRGAQFWIHAGRIANPKSVHKGIGIWKYPSGGEATRSIGFDANGPMTGLTISVAPH
jgi:hypothetical protein